MNLDTGAAVNTFPLNFGPEEAGDGRFYRTASGEWILDGGAWQFQGYDENVIAQISEMENSKEGQSFYLGHDAGYIIPIHSKIDQGMRIHFERMGGLAWKERTHSSPSSKTTF